VNHMEKQKALSPTGKKPAENSPFAETNASLGFSTDRDEPLRRSSVSDEDREGACSRHIRKNKIEIFIRNARKRYLIFQLAKSYL
jgi:hypothetical protein